MVVLESRKMLLNGSIPGTALAFKKEFLKHADVELVFAREARCMERTRSALVNAVVTKVGLGLWTLFL